MVIYRCQRGSGRIEIENNPFRAIQRHDGEVTRFNIKVHDELLVMKVRQAIKKVAQKSQFSCIVSLVPHNDALQVHGGKLSVYAISIGDFCVEMGDAF